jgi:hypothetical protein
MSIENAKKSLMKIKIGLKKIENNQSNVGEYSEKIEGYSPCLTLQF